MMAGLLATSFNMVAGVYPNATNNTGTCTQSTGCSYGKKQQRTGTQNNCVSGGTSTCTSTDCTYGAWTTVSC